MKNSNVNEALENCGSYENGVCTGFDTMCKRVKKELTCTLDTSYREQCYKDELSDKDKRIKELVEDYDQLDKDATRIYNHLQSKLNKIEEVLKHYDKFDLHSKHSYQMLIELKQIIKGDE